jgi:hypothetical protein
VVLDAVGGKSFKDQLRHAWRRSAKLMMFGGSAFTPGEDAIDPGHREGLLRDAQVQAVRPHGQEPRGLSA